MGKTLSPLEYDTAKLFKELGWEIVNLNTQTIKKEYQKFEDIFKEIAKLKKFFLIHHETKQVLFLFIKKTDNSRLSKFINWAVKLEKLRKLKVLVRKAFKNYDVKFFFIQYFRKEGAILKIRVYDMQHKIFYPFFTSYNLEWYSEFFDPEFIKEKIPKLSLDWKKYSIKEKED